MQLATKKKLYGLNAVVAATGFLMQFFIDLFDLVPYKSDVPSILGHNPPGAAGALGRVVDLLSYFTIWSNITVAVVMTLLYLDPSRDNKLFRIVRLDSLLMITVTGLVYHLLIAPYYQPESFNIVSNRLEHYITPVLTILVWVIAGPRKWIKLSYIPAALVIPSIWVGYTFLRGAFINQYPYGFIDVVELGYLSAIITVIVILLFGVFVCLCYYFLDKLISKKFD
jgi:hypothetical protein